MAWWWGQFTSEVGQSSESAILGHRSGTMQGAATPRARKENSGDAIGRFRSTHVQAPGHGAAEEPSAELGRNPEGGARSGMILYEYNSSRERSLGDTRYRWAAAGVNWLIDNAERGFRVL